MSSDKDLSQSVVGERVGARMGSSARFFPEFTNERPAFRLRTNTRQYMASNKTEKQKVTFSYVGSDAQTVSLAGDFTGWEQAPVSLKKAKGGEWKKTIELPAGKYAYRLRVDGKWREDPHCTTSQPN